MPRSEVALANDSHRFQCDSRSTPWVNVQGGVQVQVQVNVDVIGAGLKLILSAVGELLTVLPPAGEVALDHLAIGAGTGQPVARRVDGGELAAM